MKNKIFTNILLIVFIFANLAFWMDAHKIKKTWANVPQAPSVAGASLMSLGDHQLAYRGYATLLQNIGSVDGRGVALKDYNFDALGQWFMLADELDSRSDAVPMIAAYYYGAVQDPSMLDPVLDYLSVVGARPYGQKWRWLGHAVYLARHQQKDNDKALALAYKLAANENPKLAPWAKQMPVFILRDQGDPDLAYKIMLNILISNVDTMHPDEINYMKDYICNTLLKETTTAEVPPFCG